MAVFAQVAESGSFTAAAQSLGLPKSTVSQRVAELENGLGVRLMTRTTRKLHLTYAGQVYLDHCRRMMDAARAANAAMSQLRDAPAGRLRITVPEASGTRLFPVMMQVFHARYPQILVDCVVTDSELDLVKEGIDVAFRTGRLLDSSMVCRRLARIRRVLVASPAYLQQRGRPSDAGDLARHAGLIHYPIPRWPLQRGDEIVYAEPETAAYSNSLLYLLEMAQAGAGIAMLPRAMCQRELATGKLELVLPDLPPTSNDYFVITPSRDNQPAALTAFLAFVDDYGLGRRLSGEEG